MPLLLHPPAGLRWLGVPGAGLDSSSPRQSNAITTAGSLSSKAKTALHLFLLREGRIHDNSLNAPSWPAPEWIQVVFSGRKKLDLPVSQTDIHLWDSWH
jgi:hypothetical protein